MKELPLTRLRPTRSRPLRALVAVLLVTLALPVTLPAASAHADSGPMAVALPASAAPGGTTTVGGSGWPAHTLLTVLLCGQNAVAGTDDCANDAGRAVTTDAQGRFTEQINVELPPQPCPCVVHVSTVLGGSASADAPFDVVGAPVKPIPANAGGSGHLVALSESLTGDGGLLETFGAPPSRTFKVIVTNLGATPVVNPEFELGTAHSVLAPEWSAAPWQGSVAPGQKVEIDLPVQFGSGDSGRWSVALRYQGREFASAYEDLPTAWGVDAFWVLLGLVVAVGLFRIGMAVLDKVRPDVVERHRERRLAQLGRHRLRRGPASTDGQQEDGQQEGGEQEDGGQAGGDPQSEAPTLLIDLGPLLSGPQPPRSAPHPPPPPPTSAPNVPAGPPASLPWFAPGTVTVTAPPQAAPLVRRPQVERPTET